MNLMLRTTIVIMGLVGLHICACLPVATSKELIVLESLTVGSVWTPKNATGDRTTGANRGDRIVVTLKPT